jgi:hypothetical protein
MDFERMTFSQPEDGCQGRMVVDVNNDAVTIEGRITAAIDNMQMHFVAAAPADHRESFTGSGLPFASEEQAFRDTPNHGPVTVSGSGNFKLTCFMPNSYYADFNGTIVGPQVLLLFSSNGKERVVRVRLSSAHTTPYRSLTYPPQRVAEGASFYESGWRMPVRTQEQVLRDSGYPCKNNEAPNFWGLKPPM